MRKKDQLNVRVSVGTHIIDVKGDVYRVVLDKAHTKPASFLVYLGNVMDWLSPKRPKA